MATKLERNIRSIQTANARAGRVSSKVSGLEDLKRALQGPIAFGAQAVAGFIDVASQREAEDAALAATEEEILEDARGIRSNPFKASASPHARLLFNNIAAGRRATIEANGLITEINADPATLSDAAAVDARILDLRELISGSSREGFEGAALSAFDRAVLPLQNRSAEAETARRTTEGEAQVGVAIHSLITNARESSIGMEDEERQEFYADAVEEASAMMDAKAFIGISREKGEQALVDQAIAESLLNPEDFDMVVEELTKELITDPKQVRALNAAAVTARRRELELSNAEGRALTQERIVDERDAQDLMANARLPGGSMSPEDFAQLRQLSPTAALNWQEYERKESGLQSDIVVSPELANSLDILLYSDSSIESIGDTFEAKAFAFEIPFSAWQNARRILREREKPNGLLTGTVFRTELANFNRFFDLKFDEPSDIAKFSRRFVFAASQLEASVVGNPSEHVIQLGAISKSLTDEYRRGQDAKAVQKTRQQATEAPVVVSAADLRVQVDTLETAKAEAQAAAMNPEADVAARLEARQTWIELSQQLQGPPTGPLSLSVFGIGGKQGELADAIERERKQTASEVTFEEAPHAFVYDRSLPDLTDKVRITKDAQSRINAEHQRREAARTSPLQ